MGEFFQKTFARFPFPKHQWRLSAGEDAAFPLLGHKIPLSSSIFSLHSSKIKCFSTEKAGKRVFFVCFCARVFENTELKDCFVKAAAKALNSQQIFTELHQAGSATFKNSLMLLLAWLFHIHLVPFHPLTVLLSSYTSSSFFSHSLIIFNWFKLLTFGLTMQSCPCLIVPIISASN